MPEIASIVRKPIMTQSGMIRDPELGWIQPGESHWVSLRYFCVTRLVIAGLLLLASAMVGDHMLLGQYAPVLFLRVLFAYIPLGTAFLLMAVFRPRRFDIQLWAQLAVDLCVLTLLMYSSGGPRSGMAVLFLLPVAGAAILGPTLMALFFAALSSLAILGEAVWRELTFSVDTVNFVQAGLYGASLFAIALVMNRLAARLLSQEQIARLRGRALQSQIEINRAVVAEMQDGVLTLSAEGEPRSLNPAAARLLQVDPMAALDAHHWEINAAGREVTRRFLDWQNDPAGMAPIFDVAVAAPDAAGTLRERRVRVRFAPSVSSGLGSDHVVFLEDLAHVEERAQQLKLASMGRLTASIAHEIRNPLAAISHATALIAEEIADGGSSRLLRIVQDNTLRLNRIVENVLQLSRRAAVTLDVIDLRPHLQHLISEFCREQGCAENLIELRVRGNILTNFNGEHFRAALFNLLQNALRHASGRPGCIVVAAVAIEPAEYSESSGPLRVEVSVGDDGPGIDGDARQQLFEPFFTTHVRGTGLGLYLARELCLANGATLNFVSRAEESKKGVFVINASGRSS